jgi:hypothetical protein
LLREGQEQFELLPVLNGVATPWFGHGTCPFCCIQYTNVLDIA